ncbi:MAG: XapX domain-containing protein [Halobacteriaceae archaeon]
MNIALTIMALLTGAILGGVFAFLNVPVPAPPTLEGVAGIVGIFLGYRIVAATEIGIDLMSKLGL